MTLRAYYQLFRRSGLSRMRALELAIIHRLKDIDDERRHRKESEAAGRGPLT